MQSSMKSVFVLGWKKRETDKGQEMTEKGSDRNDYSNSVCHRPGICSPPVLFHLLPHSSLLHLAVCLLCRPLVFLVCSASRLLTWTICFSAFFFKKVLQFWLLLQKVSSSLCCQSHWLIYTFFVTHPSSIPSFIQPLNYPVFYAVKRCSQWIIYFAHYPNYYSHLINQ